MENPERWDVSFSGYTGTNAFNGEAFDLGITAEYELEYEIRTLSADPRNMGFTGMHFCQASGTTVMLGFWKIEARADELAACLSTKYRKHIPVFDTTIRAKEKYVWDSKNIIVPFDAVAIATQLHAADPAMTHYPTVLVPAARSSLLLSLHANGKETTALEV